MYNVKRFLSRTTPQDGINLPELDLKKKKEEV